MPMVFLTIVRSSLSASLLHGIPCAASCAYLNERMAEIGRLGRGRFRCYLAKMVLRGAQGLPDKTSPVFGKKNGTVARLQAFSRLVRFSVTRHICPPAAIILITR